jgi:hypothetical protein
VEGALDHLAGARELAQLLGAPAFVEDPWPSPGHAQRVADTLASL